MARFELAHTPMPAGYGDAVLPLEACKAHLRVDGDDEDDLISALRDAAIEYVERYCWTKLGPVTGMVWHGERLPSVSSAEVFLGVAPVTAIASISWRDASDQVGQAVIGDYRVSGKGELRPRPGKLWPSGVAGDVAVTFDAGYNDGEAPASLLSAVKLMLGHLFSNRQAVVLSGVSGEVPLGVVSLCMPFRPVAI